MIRNQKASEIRFGIAGIQKTGHVRFGGGIQPLSPWFVEKSRVTSTTYHEFRLSLCMHVGLLRSE
jgi:hypothetical protein